MLLLILDVPAYGLDSAGVHRECSVTGLPRELPMRGAKSVSPLRRIGLQVANPIGHGNLFALACQDVDVVFDTSDEDRSASQMAASAAEVSMHRFSKYLLFKEGSPIFGRKNNVDAQGGKSLRHARDVAMSPRLMSPLPGLRALRKLTPRRFAPGYQMPPHPGLPRRWLRGASGIRGERGQ